jgi:hypothetical protein
MSSRRFDFELRRYVEEDRDVYTKKQRRAFQRLMSGSTVGKSRRERLRFMTLTSSPESKGRKLNADFIALKMRILRKFHFKMKYWKIRTNEGNGVLHLHCLARAPISQPRNDRYFPQTLAFIGILHE